MKFTEAQQRAIRARGNVLVAAGAGTGKTRTLVERCLDCLLREKPEVSLDEMLMVTFTEAAAAEIRQRIRARLEQERDASPAGLRWHEQLALLDTAPIGTLHGFCLQLVRQHFYELGLDPQLAVLPGEEARLLETETLDSVLRGAYAGTDEDSAAIRELIRVQGRGWDRSIREWVHKIHDYSQTLPDPQGWIARQQAMFDEAEPRVWAGWLDEFLPGWIERARNAAGAIAANNEFARDWAGRLGAATAGDRAGWNDLLSGLLDACGGRRKALTEPLKKWIEQADFLHSLAPGGGTGALAQDWDWARLPMRALLRLTVKFQETFQESKRELGVLDFHDLEQYALRLLWDSRGPTEIARQWRRRLRFIFVDEYQDINLAQDTLLKALSRDGAEANRFLVGDVKQSIYRFRLARPEIFQGYSRQWRGAGGITVPLTENFRGREPLLEFANSLFAMVMQDPLAPCGYDEEARLRFGAAADRAPLRGKAGEALVEIHIRLKQAAGAEPAAGEDAAGELDDAGKEARLVACRLRELHRAGHPVWDDNLRAFRKVEWKDMAVLLRSPAGKAEAFAREFSKCGIPLSVARRGFYDSLEISDLVSLLQLLDNPLQDLPLLAVLRSPLAGASPDQLAEIRLASHRTHFWTALQRWRAGLASAEAGGRIAKFLDRFARWRRLSRQWSLSRCLDAVLAETDYEAWLLTQPRGAQRRANVLRLLELARQFDRFQRQGLFRFLEFVDAQRAAETEPESAGAVTDDSVQLLSIHQSKGLEFPVVALADLGKKFNETDLRADVLLDEEFGLCPQIHPPGGGGRYPSLPAWLAAQRQRRELLAEELRLLYVAVTRPRDALLLFGSISEKQFQSRWTGPDEFMPDKLLDVRSYADWIAPWFARHAAPGAEGRLSGQNDLVRWVIHEQAPALPQGKDGDAGDGVPPEDGGGTPSPASPSDPWDVLFERLSWQYAFPAAARQPAKVSVSTLRRQAEEALQDDEAQAWTKPSIIKREPAAGRASAVEIGLAHHRFLQHVRLDRVSSVAELRREAGRLQAENILSPAECAGLDFDAMAAFWNSEPGRGFAERRGEVRRELAFTARFSAAELAACTGRQPAADLAGESILVQGVVDLACILPDEIRVLDFKTDRVQEAELESRTAHYRPQLELYARALERIYGRPVRQRSLYFLAVRRAVAL